MQKLIVTALAMAGVLLPPAYADVPDILSQEFEERNGRISIRVEIGERTSLESVADISEKIFEEIGSPETVWIGYFTPDQKGGGAWAHTTRNFNNNLDTLFSIISGFSIEEWDAFARDDLTHPPESTLFGIWRFQEGTTYSSTVVIYRWNEEDYLYQRFEVDGSGAPSVAAYGEADGERKIIYTTGQALNHSTGRIETTVHDDGSDFWVLQSDGYLELWDGEGAIPGWRAENSASSDLTESQRSSAQPEAHAIAARESCGGTISGGSLMLRKEQASCQWPFTVSEVKIGCNRYLSGAGELWVEADGRRYGLNGFGITRYGQLEPIWKDDGPPPIKVNIGPWIDAALDLC